MRYQNIQTEIKLICKHVVIVAFIKSAARKYPASEIPHPNLVSSYTHPDFWNILVMMHNYIVKSKIQ